MDTVVQMLNFLNSTTNNNIEAQHECELLIISASDIMLRSGFDVDAALKPFPLLMASLEVVKAGSNILMKTNQKMARAIDMRMTLS